MSQSEFGLLCGPIVLVSVSYIEDLQQKRVYSVASDFDMFSFAAAAAAAVLH